jgi:predicted enzyme related to lactoylglutathione lyase
MQEQEKVKYADGRFSWTDLSTPDVAGAKAFYGGLFGWTSEDRATSEGAPPYTTFLLNGRTVAGAYPMSAEMQAAGAPPVWVNYISHSDIDSVAARATEAGGVVFMPPLDVVIERPGAATESMGRMALIQDPTGAAFGVWQPGAHPGAEVRHATGSASWDELQTHDVAAARAFYERVFGWQSEAQVGDYIRFEIGGEPAAGLMAIGKDWGDIPSHWNIYFWVDDVSAAAARAEELGGAVVVPPTEMGEFGEFALLRDPQGAHFIVARWTEM